MQRPTGGDNGDFKKLRHQFDSNDPFMNHGSNIKIDINQTARNEDGRQSESGSKGAHLRWHVRRGIKVTGCSFCFPDANHATETIFEPPLWVNDMKAVKVFLEKRFALWRTNDRQHLQMQRWAAVIQGYLRAGMRAAAIAQEYACFDNTQSVYTILSQVKHAMNNLRLDGKKPTGRKPGRPKKVVESASLQNIPELEIVHSSNKSLGRGITSPGTPIPSHP
jgi:hypothetical protein